MKIACIADLHGDLISPDKIPACDVLVIAGDICVCQGPHCDSLQSKWVKRNLVPWLDAIPAREIVAIAGNHDGIFQRQPHYFKQSIMPKLKWNYLQDSCVIIDHVKFYGHPWSLSFMDWNFQLSPLDLAIHDNAIPDDVDVLISHSPPYGVMDYCGMGDYGGSKSLKRRVNDMPNLKLHIFGHIHNGRGIIRPSKMGKNQCIFVNASMMDNYMCLRDKVIVVDI